VWDWVKEPWACSIQKIKQSVAPDVHKDLLTGITESEGLVCEEVTVGGDPRTNVTAQMSDVKCCNGARFLILGNHSCNKVHLVAKGPTCGWFCGPVGMIAVGLEGAFNALMFDKCGRSCCGEGRCSTGMSFRDWKNTRRTC